ncbi:radical SAM family heme chaperone HemW [Poritiphilus flavus]|uniref:Heme chaperone HemW n=1 Tax=Poritiphilus flavus TaxID=2697053 RepID=A0A6L9E746_9FLAO|nr:radical SAM family heme chaperone HemW [Poritiphilus flavus]NAS10454.1 radical SAM family heme chaperone HemW [Poritiphilus flavus]
MSSIYFHIPFCKQACHYCDFHFSTNTRKKSEMVEALGMELRLRKEELGGEAIQSIYFGGGTPSLLEVEDVEFLIGEVYENFQVNAAPEITLEANPDDLSEEKTVALAASRINRLSLGVQSFFEEDLRMMNRAHSAVEATRCLELVQMHFENLSIDLIYGIPEMSLERWESNINKALSFGIPHISAYALTVEPKTALAKFIEKGLIEAVDETSSQEHFELMVEKLEAEGFVHYEISNFGKPGFFSQNNSAYWQGKKYLGIGPSAHSYDGAKRSWSVRNNHKYLKSISNRELPLEREELSIKDLYNEYVMTGLRTIWGVSTAKVQEEYGTQYARYLRHQAQKFVEEGFLQWNEDILKATARGKFLIDGIAADLFILNLEAN